MVVIGPADANRAAGETEEDGGSPLWLFILVAAIALIVCIVGGVWHRRQNNRGATVGEGAQTSRTTAMVSNPVYASMKPIDTIAVNGDVGAVPNPTYSAVAPAFDDHGLAMQNTVYSPIATIAGNSVYDAVSSHNQIVSDPAHAEQRGRPLYSQSAVTANDGLYDDFGAAYQSETQDHATGDDGAYVTPPGGIGVPAVQTRDMNPGRPPHEGDPAGNLGHAYAMPLPVHDSEASYATLPASDAEHYSMPIAQDADGAYSTYSMPLSGTNLSSDDDAFGTYSMPLSEDAASAGASLRADRNTYNEPWIQGLGTGGDISI